MEQDWNKYRDKIIGLGEHSLRKSYYPELQEKIDNLESSQRNLETLINSISDAIIIHDREGNILSLNEQAKKTYNINEDEIKSLTIFDISSPLQETTQLKEIWAEVLNNNTKVFEWVGLQRKTNKEFQLQVSLSLTNWDNNNVIVAVIRDFSERKKFEKELIRAREKAEQANKLKTEFLNNMSHEIRTPMNGIIGFSEMLNEPDLSDEKRAYFTKIIQNSSMQLLKIIDDILDISSLETKQSKINESEFLLNDLLMELFSIFSLKSKEQNIPFYLKKELSDEQSRMITDRVKLSKVISNLLENALKFTNEGFIELGYKVKNSTIHIYVQDTGIGISSKSKDLIFERFSQEEKDISKKYGGLGLGLSISKENTELLGGKLTFESIKGKGSIFHITLPFKHGKNSSATNIETTKDFKENNEHSKTILIAEDEEINFLFIHTLLSKYAGFKFNIIHAKDGQEAVEACSNNKNIDLVLMDIKMPIMNGYEATKIIKSKFPNLPIIAQTAYSTGQERELALRHGCDDFISKPIKKDNLIKILTVQFK